jgi:acyl carrier protein
MEDFLNNFLDILDDTDKSLITPETKFKELEEWTSIMALSLLSIVDEMYEVSLTTTDIQGADTLRELYQTILQKKE